MNTDFHPYFDEMIAMRRKLHTYPEEGWCEFVTTTRIIERLKALGIPYRAGLDVIAPEAIMGRDPKLVAKALDAARATPDIDQEVLKEIGEYTGVMAEIDTGRPGPVIAFRADIDCVLSNETDDPKHLPNVGCFASTVPGHQHSCGHDGHTAVGLALCHWLVDHKDELKGRFKVLFQPAEEGVRGAAAMAAKGIVDDVDILIGSHVGCGYTLHEVGVIDSGFLATTKLDIEFFGKAAHAGSDPEKGRSALVAAAACVMALQGIPRHSAGATRVAIGTLHAGTGRNVVADY
ncbi:MAG TPA: amidohydrolase, partial [Sutterella sp.]|nr:amidohydrolase [Sutterella sp.]